MKGTINVGLNKISSQDGELYEFQEKDIINLRKGQYIEDINGKNVTFDIENIKKRKRAINIKILGNEKKKVKTVKVEESASKNEFIENSIDFYLPKDTQEVLNEDKFQFENYTLWYNKIVRNDGDNKILHDFYENNKVKSCKINYSKAIVLKLKLLQNDTAIGLFGKQAFQKLTYKADTKLLIGIGGGNPFGNVPSITLHHIYGIPYIPASTLKGITRSFYIYKEHKGKEKEALKDQRFIKWFGTSEGSGKRGTIIFLDAFPINEPTIEFEPISPHYGSYYTSQGKQPPVDYDQVIPLFVPAIVETEFDIYFGYCKDLTQDDLEQIKEYVIDAIQWIGVGAKTSSGYGIGKAVIK